MKNVLPTAKKIALSAIVIGSFALYALRQSLITDSTQSGTADLLLPNTANQTIPSNPNLNTTSTGNKYKDGQYTGIVADAYYGPMQVQAIIHAGRLTDIQILQYPNDRPTSVTINSQALPLLKQEAIRAQSAEVNGVTGASASSPAFIKSLTSALSQAQIQ